MTEQAPRPGDQTTRYVQAAITGDPAAVDWVVQRFTPALRRMIQRRLGVRGDAGLDETVDDLVQSVWLYALPRLRNVHPSERDGRHTPALLSQLSKRALGAANDVLERRLRRNVREEQLPDGSSALANAEHPVARKIRDALAQTAAKELEGRFRAAFEQLDEDAREVIALRAFEGLSNSEAAEELDEKPNTVAQRYKRALAKLRELLPDSIFEDLPDDD